MVFCDWLLSLKMMISRFIYVIACIGTSFLLSNNIPLYAHTKFCLSVHQLVSSFWLLWLILLWIFVHKFWSGHGLSFLLVDTRSRTAGSYDDCIWVAFWGTANLFFRVDVSFKNFTSNVWELKFVHISPTLVTVFFLAILVYMKWFANE